MLSYDCVTNDEVHICMEGDRFISGVLLQHSISELGLDFHWNILRKLFSDHTESKEGCVFQDRNYVDKLGYFLR